MTAGWVGAELPVGATQLHLACQHANGRGCLWGSVPATGQVRGCSVDLSLQESRYCAGGRGAQLSAQLLGPPCPHFHLQTRVEGHGPGKEAGPAPGRRWTLSVLIYDKDVRGSYAACGSRAVWVSARKRLQTSGVRLRGLLLRIAGLAD